jgi:hypothetical protein
VSLGHVPKVSRSRLEVSTIYWDRSHPLCWYCKGRVQSQWPPWQCGPYIWFSWWGWKNCGIEIGVPGRFCVQLWPARPAVLVLCAVDAPLTWCPRNGPSVQYRPCPTHRGSTPGVLSLRWSLTGWRWLDNFMWGKPIDLMLCRASTLLIWLNIVPTKGRKVTELALLSGWGKWGQQLRALWICRSL